jgi:hypothetical protein
VERLSLQSAAAAAGGGSTCRKSGGSAGDKEGKEYEVVFTTGPDVVSEAGAYTRPVLSSTEPLLKLKTSFKRLDTPPPPL